MGVKLGDRVRDKVTGFEGIAVSITEFLHGCKRVGVRSTELKDGKPIDAEGFDEPQLEVIKKKAVEEGSHRTGGERPDTPARKVAM